MPPDSLVGFTGREKEKIGKRAKEEGKTGGRKGRKEEWREKGGAGEESAPTVI